MTLQEAKEWMRGDRSSANTIPSNDYDTWEVRTAQADASYLQQAYWILRAHKEGLLESEVKDEVS